MSTSVTFAALRAANIARQAEWCPDQVPDLSFRGNELAGEGGEAMAAALDVLGVMGGLSAAIGRVSNTIKKIERERHGWVGSRATLEQLAEELADVEICGDLCAMTAGIDLGAAVIAKFNATSEKVGLTTRLGGDVPAERTGPVQALFQPDAGTEWTITAEASPEGVFLVISFTLYGAPATLKLAMDRPDARTLSAGLLAAAGDAAARTVPASETAEVGQ